MELAGKYEFKIGERAQVFVYGVSLILTTWKSRCSFNAGTGFGLESRTLIAIERFYLYLQDR
jgi:hypothetical protein